MTGDGAGRTPRPTRTSKSPFLPRKKEASKGKDDRSKKATPGTAACSRWTASGWVRGPAERRRGAEARGSNEVVAINDEGPAEPLTGERVVRLWRELLGLIAADEPANAGPMGLPQYVQDNLDMTLSEMNLEEANTMLAR